MSNSVIPCPFCGNEDPSQIEDVIETGDFGKYLAYYSCQLCNCRGPQLVFKKNVRKVDALRLALDDWNKRGKR